MTEAFPWGTAPRYLLRDRDKSYGRLNLQVQAVKLENPPYDFDAAFRGATAGGTQMLLVVSSRFFAPDRTQIAELAIAHQLPAMFNFGYARAGGPMSYGVDPLPQGNCT